MKLCVSLADLDAIACLQMAKQAPMIELRLDRLQLAGMQRQILESAKESIATCRPSSNLAEPKRLSLLERALEEGASYVDIEYEAPEQSRIFLQQAAKKLGRQVVVSFHDFEKTPSREVLLQIIEQAQAYGADVVKIACSVHSNADNATLLGLLGVCESLVVIGMGQKGRMTRVMAPLLGSLFTFVAPDEAHLTAPGQWTFQEMQEIRASFSAWGLTGGGAP